MIVLSLILLLTIFFAVNMGGASFAAAFAAAYGGKTVTRVKANLLFLFFVILGAILFGKKVSYTLGKDIFLVQPEIHLSPVILIVIFFTAGISMFISNMMKIPQSTSLVTVASIAGVAAACGNLNISTIYYFLPFWIIFPIASFVITYKISKMVYPPRRSNFWIYEKLVNQRENLRKFVIIASCYSAFSVGSNNVPNVVGPLSMLGNNISVYWMLLIFAGIYGCGAMIFSGPLKTAGAQIVPLGLLTAAIIAIVSGSLMIFASGIGIPQSFVMLQMGGIFAIASLKEGKSVTFKRDVTKTTLYTWTINPLITFCISFGLYNAINLFLK